MISYATNTIVGSEFTTEQVINSAVSGRINLYSSSGRNITKQFLSKANRFKSMKYGDVNPIICNKGNRLNLSTLVSNFKRQYKHFDKLDILELLRYENKLNSESDMMENAMKYCALGIKLPSGKVIKVNSRTQAENMLNEIRILNCHL